MDKFGAFRNQKVFDIPKTMQAVVFSGLGSDSVTCRQVPVSMPGPDQLLCRVDAAGVCTSILKILAQGSKHTYLNGWDSAKFPLVLGDEGAVTVAAVGENLADRYRPGQRFAIQPSCEVSPICHRERYTNNGEGMRKLGVGYTLPGHLAEYILVQEEVLAAQSLLALPTDELPYFAVSMAEPISCVCSAQERQIHLHKEGPFAPRVPKLGLLPGGTAVVIGAGAMGRMHVEMAMRFKPKTLIVSDVLQERLDITVRALGEKAKRLGIDLQAVPADKLKDTVSRVSGGTGADDVILAVGIQPVQQTALELLGKGGVANLFGGLPRGKHILNVDAIAIHYDEIKLVGSSGGDPSDMIATLKAIAAGDIDPGNYVYGIGSLQHVPQVLRMIEQAQVDGKVIIYPHARADDLHLAEHWDKSKEEQYLNGHLP